MNSKLLNLCTPVREAIHAMGFSSVAIVAAINAQRGEAVLVNTKAKAGSPTGKRETKKREAVYRIGESVSYRYEGDLNIAQDFDVWHAKVEKANDWCAFETIGIPAKFVAWLKSKPGFAAEKPEAKAEAKPAKADKPASEPVKA
jgi:hypothetical protein